MPRGTHLCPELRKPIHRHMVELHKSPEQVHTDLFYNDHSLYSLARLRDLHRLFTGDDQVKINAYLDCVTTRKGAAGRPMVMQIDDCQLLRSII